jgi:hypothetical protein
MFITVPEMKKKLFCPSFSQIIAPRGVGTLCLIDHCGAKRFLSRDMQESGSKELFTLTRCSAQSAISSILIRRLMAPATLFYTTRFVTFQRYIGKLHSTGINAVERSSQFRNSFYVSLHPLKSQMALGNQGMVLISRFLESTIVSKFASKWSNSQ